MRQSWLRWASGCQAQHSQDCITVLTAKTVHNINDNQNHKDNMWTRTTRRKTWEDRRVELRGSLGYAEQPGASRFVRPCERPSIWKCIFTLSGHTKILLVVNIVYGLQQNEGGILPQRQAVSHGSEVLRSPHPCPPVIICLTHIVFYNPIFRSRQMQKSFIATPGLSQREEILPAQPYWEIWDMNVASYSEILVEMCVNTEKFDSHQNTSWHIFNTE